MASLSSSARSSLSSDLKSITKPTSKTTSIILQEPTSTPSYHSSKYLFTIHTTTSINATLQDLIHATRDTKTWSRWNSFIPHVTILSQPLKCRSENETGEEMKGIEILQLGTEMNFSVTMEPGQKPDTRFGDQEVTCMEEFQAGSGKKGWKVAWKSGSLWGWEWLLRSERVMEFREVGGEMRGVVEMESWACYGGLGARVMWWLGRQDVLRERFGDWGEGLRRFVEGVSDELGERGKDL